MPWRVVLENLRAHKLRTFLTVMSIAVAVFLLCFLRTVLVSLQAAIDGSKADRLVAQSAVSLFVDLPLSYQAKIEAVPGVGRTCKLQWFGAYYREPSNFFAQFGVDADRFLEAYPEVEIIEGDAGAFRQRKTACFIGHELARRFGFRIGDRVPLIGTIFPRADGRPWEFEVVGIYRSKASNVDNNTLWFRFDYLEESIRAGDVRGFTEAGVGVYMISLEQGADPIGVASQVDALFAGGPQRVQTTSEAEFQRQFVSMMGGVPMFLSSISGAILFAILLAAVNTMLMSFRQRTKEFGILKALGFTDSDAVALLLAESVGICVLGGLLGVGTSLALAGPMATAMASMFPTFELTRATMAQGLGLSLGVGVLAGVLPALRASRLDPVEAFREEV